ncbi:hypothetical protein D8770_17635 [Methylobacterium sp. DB1607]|nr:hypothetical protein [Methylobacterium sp. DB1607]
MQDRKPARRVLAVAALLTGLGMAALPTTGMAILMPWLMQQGAFPASTAALIQAAHTYGLVLGGCRWRRSPRASGRAGASSPPSSPLPGSFPPLPCRSTSLVQLPALFLAEGANSAGIRFGLAAGAALVAALLCRSGAATGRRSGRLSQEPA